MAIARGLRSMAWAAAVVAVTVSCSGGEPEPMVPTSPPTSSTSAPTSEPSPEPTEPWQEKSYDGAEAFATHWFDVFSEAMPTGDTSEMRAISDPKCVNCKAFADLLDGWYEAGGYYRSKGWDAKQATRIRGNPLTKPVIGVQVLQNRARIKESADSKVDVDTSGTRVYEAELRWVDSGWLMFRLEPIA